MSDILTHVDQGVMTLTFNRPDRKNSITSAMYSALADSLAQAETDVAVRVVVLQGHETVFSAGNDVSEFLSAPPSGEAAPVFRFLKAIATFSKPLVAAVCGPAVGIGTTLLFHCDLVYAGDNAAFSMPFVNLGLCAEGGSSLLAPRMFGYHRAAEALLLGDAFYAEAALEVGLVNKVLPPSEANAYARAVARKLALKPHSSLVATKRLMKQGLQEPVLQTMTEEAQVFGAMLHEPAAKEAFAAFLGKRQPDFSKV